MFTSEKRVIRDGYLVAFAGETMSDEEAAARGLLTHEAEDKPKRKTTRRKAKPKQEPEEVEEDLDEDIEDEEA